MDGKHLMRFQSESGTRPKKWFRAKTRFYSHKRLLGNGYSVAGKDSAGLTLSVQSETLRLNVICSENSNRFRSFEVDLATLLSCLLL